MPNTDHHRRIRLPALILCNTIAGQTMMSFMCVTDYLSTAVCYFATFEGQFVEVAAVYLAFTGVRVQTSQLYECLSALCVSLYSRA